MSRPRFRYSLLTSLAVVAVIAILLGALKSAERERSRRSLGGVRLTAALRNYQGSLKQLDGGEIRLETVYTWSLRVMEAERDLAGTWGDRVAAVEAHRARMEAIQKSFEASAKELVGGSARSSQMSRHSTTTSRRPLTGSRPSGELADRMARLNYERPFPEAPAMRLPRLRFTVRRLMVAVAALAACLGSSSRRSGSSTLRTTSVEPRLAAPRWELPRLGSCRHILGPISPGTARPSLGLPARQVQGECEGMP